MSRNRVLPPKLLGQKSVGPRQDSETPVIHYIFIIIAYFEKWRMPLYADLKRIQYKNLSNKIHIRKSFINLMRS